MSELQITAMKSKNSTSNVYLVLQNHSQLPSLAVHVQQTALLVLKLSNLYVWQVKRMQFEPNFYHLKKKKFSTYRRRQTRWHLSYFLCLERICTQKKSISSNTYIRWKRTNSYTAQILPSMINFLFPISCIFYSLAKEICLSHQYKNATYLWSLLK